jgi:C4-dicarboxylate-specific signal transduction histidine kinase
LLETSRQAGMAEVATSVLHNVGNVLNSINVSTTLVTDMIRKSKMTNLGRVAAILEDNQKDLAKFLSKDPKGSQLPQYLARLAEHLGAEQATLLKEMDLTRKHIEHVKDIVMMQQAYAKVAGVSEKIKVTELVEDALRMNIGSLVRHDVKLNRDYPMDIPEVNVERHKVLQILVNLIRNAKYACEESGNKDKQLTLQVRTTGDRVKIAIIDNGVGIPAANMTRIFNHGFTTRKDGHGFGLHSGALAAKEIGGSLSARSEGLGKGATFVLELPIQSPHLLDPEV